MSQLIGAVIIGVMVAVIIAYLALPYGVRDRYLFGSAIVPRSLCGPMIACVVGAVFNSGPTCLTSLLILLLSSYTAD